MAYSIKSIQQRCERMKKIQSIKNIDLAVPGAHSLSKRKGRQKEQSSPFKLNLKIKNWQISSSSNIPALRTVNQRSKSKDREQDSTQYNTDRHFVLNQFNTTAKDSQALADKDSKIFNLKSYVRLKPAHRLEHSFQFDIPNSHTIVHQENIFKFDRIFTQEVNQSIIYEGVGRQVAEKFMEGYNGTVFAYGNTGSGKTYTMFGNGDGIVPCVVEHVFSKLDLSRSRLSCSMLQIYKQNLIDLFASDAEPAILKIKQTSSAFTITNLSMLPLSTREAAAQLISKGNNLKKTRETSLNEASSRSHIVFTLYLQSQQKGLISCRLNLVDLAGSQKVSKSKVQGEGLEEAKKINLSLSCLGNTINALVSGCEHIPYRQSKLTRILRQSLMGNSITRLIVTASLNQQSIEETISSLKFAQRARKVRTQAEISYNVSRYKVDKIQNIKKLRDQIQGLTFKFQQIRKVSQACPGRLSSCCCQEILKIADSAVKSAMVESDQQLRKKYETNCSAYESQNNFFSHKLDLSQKEEAVAQQKQSSNGSASMLIKILEEQNQCLQKKILRLQSKIKCLEAQETKITDFNIYPEQRQRLEQINQNILSKNQLNYLPERKIIKMTSLVKSPYPNKAKQIRYCRNREPNYNGNSIENCSFNQKSQDSIWSQEKTARCINMLQKLIQKLAFQSAELKQSLYPLQSDILKQQVNFLQNLVVGQQGGYQTSAWIIEQFEALVRSMKAVYWTSLDETMSCMELYGRDVKQELQNKLSNFLAGKRTQIARRRAGLEKDQEIILQHTRSSMEPRHQKQSIARSPFKQQKEVPNIDLSINPSPQHQPRSAENQFLQLLQEGQSQIFSRKSFQKERERIGVVERKSQKIALGL